MSTTEVTLDMCLVEMKQSEKDIRELSKQGKINPYNRDHRLAVLAKMVNLLEQAKANKNTNNPNFIQLLNNLP